MDRPGLNTAGDDGAWDSLRERVAIVVRPIGAPMSIGFFVLAAATFALSGLQLGWVDQGEVKKVAVVLLAFALPAQPVAGIFGFLARDGIAGTAMLALGFSWLGVAAVLWTSMPGSTSDVLGLFLIFACVAMTLCATTAAVSKLYTAWAAAIEDAQGRTVLPLGRHGKGKLAIHGSLLGQVKEAPTEPGVRTQL